jgi:predicted membrane protein
MSNGYRWDLVFNDHVGLDLNINCGAGESRLELGELSLRHVNVEMGLGEVRMDLRGQPKNDYDVSIHGGIGEATIYLPSDVGIEATAHGGIGEISASGLEKQADRYVNSQLGHAKTTIRLNVQGGIGEIRLIAN